MPGSCTFSIVPPNIHLLRIACSWTVFVVSDKLVAEPVTQLTRSILITKVLQRSPFKAQKQSTARRIGAENFLVLRGLGESF
ncbi:hypothetical protein VCR26J2_370389 [Vibrio coralliirubri]|nr:hypothetical protein VCR1J2_200416 [Vibrio coralliirubri]CDT75356.1 hypothetical protein VCR8J2_190326 [Vibrio coralliirubri]CDT77312.1 hypothetical protein VCR26J2_370389 [Vibrio coralliirubri]